MATLLDWNAVSHKVKSYMGESPYCTTASHAFTYVALGYLLTLSPEEIEDAITDGPNDRGIDAVFVDERDGRNVIHLFQFKYVNSFEKAKKNFPSAEIDKLLSFCADLLNKEQGMKETCNPILWTKVQEIWSALRNPTPFFEVHFCANMRGLVEPQKQRVMSALSAYRSFNVNHHTLDSLLSDRNVEFWYLNNGITITCDSFSYQPGVRAPVVTLENVQIVNGGQTSNALFEAYREQPERLQKVLILARIYETRARNIAADIAEATNSQTPINTRDLRSNDDVKKKLEESFLDQGMYYERKARQHHEQPRRKRIDAMSAGQAFLPLSGISRSRQEGPCQGLR